MIGDLAPPQLTFLARIRVDVGSPIDLGVTAGVHRRIVPIVGGTVTGPEISGTVLPGGADFQVLPSDRPQDLQARYAIETDDGERIYVRNRGMRSGAPEVLHRLSNGESVDPKLIYFRSTPRLHAPAGRLDWLNARLFVARGERLPSVVQLDVFVLE